MRKATTNINTLLLSLSLLGLSACGGPSKAGLEAREDAYSRIDLINTQIGYSQAQQAFETGQLRDSLELIEKTVERYPDAAEYHLLHGRVLLELHRLDESLAAFESAVERDEELADAHYFMGIVHQRWSEDEEAYEHYLHHRHFTVNFGNAVIPLDKWFGTFHDGTPEAQRQMLARRGQKKGTGNNDSMQQAGPA